MKSIVVDKKKGQDVAENEIAIVVDNAGYELVSDLVLGHCLLTTGKQLYGVYTIYTVRYVMRDLFF